MSSTSACEIEAVRAPESAPLVENTSGFYHTTNSFEAFDGSRKKVALLIMAFMIVSACALRLLTLNSATVVPDERTSWYLVGGHTRDELLANNGQKPEIYNSVAPGTSEVSVVKKIASEAADQVPVYYVLARIWSRLCHGVCSVDSLRVLTAIFGILLVPAIYSLSRELNLSRASSLFCATVVALSPLHFYHAQHARPYSLWSVLICLSSVALLRAVRESKRSNWIIYAIAITFALFTHLVTVLVMAAHTVFVLWDKRFSITRNDVAFGGCMATISALTLPWLLLIHRGHATTTHWLLERKSPMELLRGCAGVLSDTFICAEPSIWFLLSKAALLILILCATFDLVRRTSSRSSKFLLSLFLVPIMLTAARDICAGSFCCTISRYLIPSLISVEIIVAAFLVKIFRDCVSYHRSQP